jgi:pimeloyl-ACP methyl ester carboxylesterase
MRPQTKYAKSRSVRVAYQVTGTGPVDLVWAPGTVSQLDLDWDWPPRRRFLEKLGESFRLIRFDKRGTGLSDRPTTAARLEERMDDIRAVMDAAGSESAAILGLSEGGSMACLFAATYPARTRALLLWGVQARWTQAPDYPWGPTREEQLRMIEDLADNGVTADYLTGPGYGLGPNPDPAMLDWCFRYSRAGASPSTVAALERMVLEIDTRDFLGAIRVPTLVMNRVGDPVAQIDAARDLCARIPGARMREWPGSTHGFADIADEVIPEIVEFVSGAGVSRPSRRVFGTVLAIRFSQSGSELPASGASAPRPEVRHRLDELARAAIERYQGRESTSRGSGRIAVFDGPARAIDCAKALRESVWEIGIEVRAGLHSGECELIGDELGGAPVLLAGRIGTAARPGDILVSGAVRNLLSWSGFELVPISLHSGTDDAGALRIYRAL